MRTDTNGSSVRSRFDLAQRALLRLRSQGYTRKSRLVAKPDKSSSRTSPVTGL
jgi:hypothetical protein